MAVADVIEVHMSLSIAVPQNTAQGLYVFTKQIRPQE